MRSNFADVGDFHEKFGLHCASSALVGGVGPQEVSVDLLKFRINFMTEELMEFITAAGQGDQAGMADALIDLVYVAMGTAHLFGYPWQALWNEVQRANMTKQRAQPNASDSKRGSSFDVIKPPGWTPPDVEGVLRAHGFFTACTECPHLTSSHKGSRCLACEEG